MVFSGAESGTDEALALRGKAAVATGVFAATVALATPFQPVVTGPASPTTVVGLAHRSYV